VCRACLCARAPASLAAYQALSSMPTLVWDFARRRRGRRVTAIAMSAIEHGCSSSKLAALPTLDDGDQVKSPRRSTMRFSTISGFWHARPQAGDHAVSL